VNPLRSEQAAFRLLLYVVAIAAVVVAVVLLVRGLA
jgi:predicted nucleic acid-binding Zn ribbon protein